MPGTPGKHGSAEVRGALPDSAQGKSLEDILEPERVLCDAIARSKKHALDLVSEILASGERPLHKLDVFESLVSRERLGSTAIGHGIAIPHARIDSLLKIRAAFVRLAEPVDFDAADGQPVRILFGLLVPVGDEEAHLALLSTIASMLADADYRKSLDEAEDADALYDLLTEYNSQRSEDAPDSR